MIEFKHVTKKFGDKVVLDDLSMIIPDGKITFIIGKSGEGKSVTIKHILGLMKPSSGRVFIGGKDLSELSPNQIRAQRRKIGMLFQQAALFDSLSVFENIAFPLVEYGELSQREIIDRAREVLGQVGLEGCEEKMPNELSTGEKKRVGLARALAPRPEIILYDEPTTGMDPMVSEMIDDLIVKVGKSDKNLTSVVISHDLKASLDIADYIVMLYQGKVQLAGSPKAFKASQDGVIRQFFGGKIDGPMKFY